ncbi:Brefeldin A resistance protein [Sphaceloma murrayae]|uniref:Brefeldin A resistance protein n=1 Tax=Sphaceloma murrayae TaxID=2082308 RepID=A0A2K1QHW5_9PEZI|nr:Brefeldin A resistance protein [Sphaceloma murrayae]
MLPQLITSSPWSSGTLAVDNHPEVLSSSTSDLPPSTFLDDTDTPREELIRNLARTLTISSAASAEVERSEERYSESAYDPHSPGFSAKAWVQRIVGASHSEGRRQLRLGGVSFTNLSAFGYSAATSYQKDVGNVWLDIVRWAGRALGVGRPLRINILTDLEGLVESGEMLVVLGPPGSGCSTFLKTITGEVNGFEVNETAELNYNGVSATEMHDYFKGEAIYTAEVDVHFPMLSVGDTLSFAARARMPRTIPAGFGRTAWADHLRDVTMATFGIMHTFDTRVGNDFVRGVSGGERKRVSIAEAALSGAPIQAWDNSTRGLDSANAIEFCKTIRLCAKYVGTTAMVSLYQAPQSAYEQFDKVLVLYQGRQIFFGRIDEAQEYFERLGFVCPERQTTADFLTSMTSPAERIIRPGHENKVPRNAEEFAHAWTSSLHRKHLLQQISEYKQQYPIGGAAYTRFISERKRQQSRGQRIRSPFTLNYVEQVQLCLWRGFKRLVGDPAFTRTQLGGNFVLALIIGSVFYNTPGTAESFFRRGATLFFAILMNAFGSALEILTLYAQRPIVEKQARYGMYHPSAEALSSILVDMPYKITNAITFNATLYFMTNLRRQPGNFFFFVFVTFSLTLAMSMLFRTIGSISRTRAQALAPAANIMLGLVIFTGFAIPEPYMLGWSRWIKFINPIAYGFESLMINEFSGRQYPCTVFVPPYGSLPDQSQVCTAIGSVPGQSFVEGTRYIISAYGYNPPNKWRNIGILYGMAVGLLAMHLLAIELISEKKSKGEVLVYQKGKTPTEIGTCRGDVEANVQEKPTTGSQDADDHKSDTIQRQESIFSWKNVCFDVKTKKDALRILDNVDGWVKPGALTALMGVSGAGKTTLLDVLATRVTVGVVTGEMLVDGRAQDSSFQRKTGYVQQQDLHLQTSSVREALTFSALLRQPRSVSRQSKLAYVEEVIKLLDMGAYADAVVGVPGEGLNVEQRKRLTIAVELVAKPELLLFLDEPTSGLDSQTSWAICNLMEKLKDSGQAILCTIHQPSAMLFQRFDRLLLLAKGGKTVYFGDIGHKCRTMIDYFERYGGSPCPDNANPAEWMLSVIGAAPGTITSVDWPQTWKQSPEYKNVHKEIDRLNSTRIEQTGSTFGKQDKDSYRQLAAPMIEQVWQVTYRVFQQYWRTLSYIYSKLALCLFSSLFVGFVFFRADNTQRGLQNQMFSVFVHLTIFNQLAQQIMPHFVTQRSLYEARERPSKIYSWQAFIISNIFVELCWNSLMAVIMFCCYYYPVGLYRNAIPTDEVHVRGALYFLFMLQFLLWTSTFTSMIIAGLENPIQGGNIANLMFSLALVFCGVLAPPQSLPGFWIFLYRASPFTYLVGGFLTSGLSSAPVRCAENELISFKPPPGSTCESYMQPYINRVGGYLQDPGARTDCAYCTFDDSNVFLNSVGMDYKDVWRNFGLVWVYIGVNIAGAIFFYWLRVPKGKKSGKTKVA